MKFAFQEEPKGSARIGKAVAMALSLITGSALVAHGLASPEHSGLSLLALLPLFAAIRLCRPFGACMSGLLWGCSLYGFSLLQTATGIDAGLGSFLLLALVPAAYALLGSVMTRRIGFSPFVLGVSWMGVELALSPLGLEHGLLAGLLGGSTVFHFIGGALGYVLVAFAVAYVSAILLSAVSRVRLGSPARRYVSGLSSSGTLLVPQTFSCFPLFSIRPSHPRGPPVVPATLT